jgi:hypothetical protein
MAGIDLPPGFFEGPFRRGDAGATRHIHPIHKLGQRLLGGVHIGQRGYSRRPPEAVLQRLEVGRQPRDLIDAGFDLQPVGERREQAGEERHNGRDPVRQRLLCLTLEKFDGVLAIG